MKLSISAILFLTFLPFQASFAADDAENSSDPYTRMTRVHSSVVIDDNGASTETREFAMSVLDEQAIKFAKQYAISYSTSIQQLDIVEAYTTKADGRRIDSEKSDFQIESNSGYKEGAPAFSDITTLTVIFPNLEVGDTVALTYRLETRQPIFPGHFSTSESFAKTFAFDDVRVRIETPATKQIQYQTREMTEVTNTVRDGRRILEWTFSNPVPINSKRYDYSVYDLEKEPGYELSTFTSHREIAEAYGVEARRKATVTERIKKLADDLTKDTKTPKDTARVLYEWVARNISYAGNCIGVGTVVPRDLEIVLNNRMGDCKDHATLLQALLTAKGIANTQALINAGASYKLPKTPVVSMVNHVINYIPSLDLYLDSTSNTTPFGMLPFSAEDKPVLHVDGFREGTRTPASPIGSNQQTMKTTATVLPDGTVKGQMNVSFKGIFAVAARENVRQMRRGAQEDLVKNLYKRMGYSATGTFQSDDPSPLLDTFSYSVTFEVENLLQYPGAGAFPIVPFFYSEAPVESYVTQAIEADDTAEETACTSGRSTEEYVFTLPKEMNILSIPDDLKTANSFVSYEASHVRKNNILTVRRTLDDRTAGRICKQKQTKEYREWAKKVLPNLRSPLLYK